MSLQPGWFDVFVMRLWGLGGDWFQFANLRPPRTRDPALRRPGLVLYRVR